METKFNWPNGQAPQETSHRTLISLVILLLLMVAGIAAYIYYGMRNTPADQTSMQDESAETQESEEGPQDSPSQDFTLEEREARLRTLEANPDGLSDEERRARLEALESTPSDETEVVPIDYPPSEPDPVSEQPPAEVIESNFAEPAREEESSSIEGSDL